MAVSRFRLTADNQSMAWSTFSPAAGDLALVFFANDGGDNQTAPGGSFPFARIDSGDGSADVSMGLYRRVCTGTETGNIITNEGTFGVSGEEYIAHVIKVPAGEWSGDTDEIIVATKQEATSGTINGNTVTPTWDGAAEEWLNVYAAARDDDDGITSLGAAYATNFQRDAAGTSGPEIVSSWQLLTAANANPGNATQTNTNEALVSINVAVRVTPPSGISAVTPDPLRMDEAAAEITGLDLGVSPGVVYISDVSTLAGGSNEVDISDAIDGWSATSIDLDLTLLDPSDLEALHNLGPGARFMIVVTSGAEESSVPVTLKRPVAIVLSASPHVTASGENTTAQLTPPSGKSGDFTPGRISDDENPLDAINMDEDFYTELEICLAFTDQALLDEPYVIEVLFEGEPLAELSVTPTVTPVVGGIDVVVGKPSESEVPVAVSAVKPISVGVATAVHGEEAQPVDADKPISVSVSAAVSTESVFTIEVVKPIVEAVLSALETEAAREVEVVKPVSLEVGSVAEVEAAQDVDPTKPIVAVVTAAGEAEVARAVEALKPIVAALGSAEESEVAHAVEALKPILTLVGLAAETEAAREVSGAKAVAVSSVTSLESAHSLESVQPQVVSVGGAAEVEVAGGIDTTIYVATGAAAEAEVASGVAVAQPQVVAVTGAISSEQGHSVAPVKPIVVSVGTAVGSEGAQAVDVAVSRLIVVGSAAEVEVGWTVSPVKPIVVPIDVALELEQALGVHAGAVVGAGAAGEVEQAHLVLADKPITVLVGSVVEAEQVVVALPVKPIFIPVGGVFEAEVVSGVEYRRRVPVGTPLEVEAVSEVLADKPIFVTMERISEAEVAVSVQTLIIGEVTVDPAAVLLDVVRRHRGVGVHIRATVVEAVEGEGVSYKPVVVVKGS